MIYVQLDDQRVNGPYRASLVETTVLYLKNSGPGHIT